MYIHGYALTFNFESTVGGRVRPQFCKFLALLHWPMGTGLVIPLPIAFLTKSETKEFAFQLLLAPEFSFCQMRLDLEVHVSCIEAH